MLPTKVVTAPVAITTLRTRLPFCSDTKATASPDNNETPVGALNLAYVPAPLLLPAVPSPANVDTKEVLNVILRTR
jgi:hypothetical protein